MRWVIDVKQYTCSGYSGSTTRGTCEYWLSENILYCCVAKFIKS